jgi:hypothetical protein
MTPFALAIFLSAFLLFQIQPIIARYILPWYGGSPAVWTACMMFFQVALLCGYLYAHLLAKYVPSRRQPILHLVLLAFSFLLLPVAPPNFWAVSVSDLPALQILALLSISVGIPFVLISASAPLLQHWFSVVRPEKSPFRLYALSNLGSLVALLSYPTLFEPRLTLDSQTITWSGLYLALTAVCIWCAMAVVKIPDSGVIRDRPHSLPLPPVSALDRVLWVALAACGSTVLLAMTNQICQDISVVPFLWILPLSLYLISFIICFDNDIWYKRRIWITLLLLVLVPLLQLMPKAFIDSSISIFYPVGIYCLALFACCMVCHGELARRRSAAPQLTSFYLYVAFGGALGGVFVNLLAPVLFADFWELHVAVGCTVILAGVCVAIDKQVLIKKPRRAAFVCAWSVVTAALLVELGMQIRSDNDHAIYNDRGFFGVMSVYENDTGTIDHGRGLYHGKVLHGFQLLHESKRRSLVSYFGINSGVGAAMRHHPRRQSADPGERGLKIGVVGLGVGTLSAYGTSLDSIRYYEINPQVEVIARKYFSYLQSGYASTEVVLGDARVSLKRELDQSGSNEFDVLVLDAFNGDAIPIHLLTEEAFDLYAEHLRNDGILAVNTTNFYVDISDIVRGAAQRMGKQVILIEDDAEHWYEDSNEWVLVASNPDFMRSRRNRSIQSSWDREQPRPIRWTDDFSNLLQIIDWDQHTKKF